MFIRYENRFLYYEWLSDAFGAPPLPEKRGNAFAALFDGGPFPTEEGVEGSYHFILGESRTYFGEHREVTLGRAENLITPYYTMNPVDVRKLATDVDNWVWTRSDYTPEELNRQLGRNHLLALVSLHEHPSIGMFVGPLPAALVDLYRKYNEQIEEGRALYREYEAEAVLFGKAVKPYMNKEMLERYEAETGMPIFVSKPVEIK